MFLRLFERLFVVVLLLSSMGVVDALTRPSLAPGDPSVISTDVPLSVAFFETAVYGCGAILVLLRWRRVLHAACTVWPLIAYTLLAPLSIAWSVQPLYTLRRSVLVLGTTFLGLYLGERYSIRTLAHLLAESVCLLMLSTVALYFVAPGYVIDYLGSWKGLSQNKNAFGAYMAIAVILLLLIRFRHFRWLRYLFLSTATILLLLSRSATSLVVCVLMISIMPLWRVIRADPKTRRLVYLLTLMALCTGIYLIWAEQAPLFHVLGRDSTLSGRTGLWATVLDAIAKHPMLGYGCDAFWGTLKGETLDLWIRVRWLPMAADNGYLDLLLSFGVLGFPVFAYALVYSFRMAIAYNAAESERIALWPGMYLSFFALHNVFESHLMTTRSLEFLMFAAITTSLDLQHRRSHAVDIESVAADDWVTSPVLARAPSPKPSFGYRFNR